MVAILVEPPLQIHAGHTGILEPVGSQPELSDGGGGFSEVFAEGDRPRNRCGWADTVCMESPEYVIIPYSRNRVMGGEESINTLNASFAGEIYCQRHYVLSLVQYSFEFDCDCGYSKKGHFDWYGPINQFAGSKSVEAWRSECHKKEAPE